MNHASSNRPEIPPSGCEMLCFDVIDTHILMVTLNRPQRANAFTTQMARELWGLWSDLYLAPDPFRCIILTGAGERAFCAGADLRERDGMTDEDWHIQHGIFEQAFYRMMDCPVPVIAAVNGAAIGGGFEMALAADFIYAVRDARFALTETSLGIMPGVGGTQNLPRAIGVRRAKEMVMTGRACDGETALRWGLVNELFDDGEKLREGVVSVAGRIASNAPLAVRQACKSVGMAANVDLHSGIQFELESYNRLISTRDRTEGIRAFNEKRRPNFVGK